MRSPIRPAHQELIPASEPAAPSEAENNSGGKAIPTDPKLAVATLKKKMEDTVSAFANGELNRAQFNAIYGRFDEQRAIIEGIIARDPSSTAWQQVVQAGQTTFLRDHFAARCIYYLVFRLGQPRPLMMGGQQQPDIQQIVPILSAVYKMPNRPDNGLARKKLQKSQWLILAVGKAAMTVAVFNLEPSPAQLRRVRDLHNDFERANALALQRGTTTLEQMVFPQRALVEQG
jgi:hypothetical protein